MKHYIGIDIGTNGGIVVIDNDNRVIETFKTPENRKDWLKKLAPYQNNTAMCVLEKVHSMPQNGGKANFTFGQTSERVLFALEVCRIPFMEVTPQTWMKFYSMKKEKSETITQWKNRLKTKASQLYPSEKVTLYLADAYLQAFYAKERFK